MRHLFLTTLSTTITADFASLEALIGALGLALGFPWTLPFEKYA